MEAKARAVVQRVELSGHMTPPVTLGDVLEHMELSSDEHMSYINRKTGEIIHLTGEELQMAEDPAEAEFAADWQKETIAKAREVMESADYIALPGKFEIDEWSIVDRFVKSLTDARMSHQLDAAIHGRGAFRRFKETVRRLAIAEDWYRFRTAAIEEIAIDFLEAHGIAYRREPRQR